MTWFLNLSLLFTAGAIGGLVNAFVVWFFGYKGISALFGVQLVPKMTTAYLYPKIVWGGLWGFLFIFAKEKETLFYLAGVISFGPTLMQLIYIFPKQDLGLGGLKLGNLTPFLVFIFNIFWAYSAATWIYFTS